MGIIYRLSALFSVLTLVLGWAAYPPAGAVGEYRFDGSRGKDTGSVVGTVWLVGAYERPARLKVFKNRDFCGPSVANESLLVNSDGGVQNTVIVLQPHRPSGTSPARQHRSRQSQLRFYSSCSSGAAGQRVAPQEQRSDSSHCARPFGQRDVVQCRASQVETSHEVSHTKRHYQNSL